MLHYWLVSLKQPSCSFGHFGAVILRRDLITNNTDLTLANHVISGRNFPQQLRYWNATTQPTSSLPAVSDFTRFNEELVKLLGHFYISTKLSIDWKVFLCNNMINTHLDRSYSCQAPKSPAFKQKTLELADWQKLNRRIREKESRKHAHSAQQLKYNKKVGHKMNVRFYVLDFPTTFYFGKSLNSSFVLNNLANLLITSPSKRC